MVSCPHIHDSFFFLILTALYSTNTLSATLILEAIVVSEVFSVKQCSVHVLSQCSWWSGWNETSCRLRGAVKPALKPHRRPLCVAGLSNSHIRPAGKAASVSLNWSCSDGGVEEVSTATGRRRDSRAPSRLCRRTMFNRWLRLQQQVSLNAEIYLELSLDFFRRGERQSHLKTKLW